MTLEQIHALTGIDPWFLDNICTRSSSWRSGSARRGSLEDADDALLREAKQNGFSDRQLAHALGHDRDGGPRDRKRRGIVAMFKLVDTCAAEFEAVTPYYYSTYEDEDETPPSGRARSGW